MKAGGGGEEQAGVEILVLRLNGEDHDLSNMGS